MFGDAFRGQTVLVTGHTGFKGAWLSIWLRALGARVVGYALDAPTQPSLFAWSGLASQVVHVHGDIRDREHLREVVDRHRPDFVFHLAAQPLVLESYRDPFETFEVNVMGTLALLDALRSTMHACAVVVVSTDKCYENREWDYGYRESDPLGGHDPYSASKAAMEIALASYQRSFFAPKESVSGSIRVASARAGNVIGGGDWSANRIVPDTIRALASNISVAVRNPESVRPWQHVLEPLSGYLWLATRLSLPEGDRYTGGWNFGPNNAVDAAVKELVAASIRAWGSGAWHDASAEASKPHEAQRLGLAIDKAQHQLGWRPVWGFEQTVATTVGHYKALLQAGGDQGAANRTCLDIIARYEQSAKELKVAWAAQ